MRHLPGDPHFVAESHQRGLAEVRRRQKLQRDGLVEDHIERFVDLAHAASAEQAENAVASSQDRAGAEAALFRRARRRSRVVQQSIRLTVGGQHPLDLPKQVHVAGARAGRKRLSFGRGTLQRRFEDRPQAGEAFRSDRSELSASLRWLWHGAPFNNESGNAAVRVSSRRMEDRPPPSQQITAWLADWRRGNTQASERLAGAVHAELRQIAARFLRHERQGHTLEPHALVNELWIRLMGGEPVSYQNRAHFFAIAAQTMRRILIDHARARIAGKRGGDQQQVSLSAVDGWSPVAHYEDMLVLDQALSKLARADPRAARVVELRFFSGLQEDEVAEVLGVSVITVKRDWKVARAWLAGRLNRVPDTGPPRFRSDAHLDRPPSAVNGATSTWPGGHPQSS